MSNLTGPQIKYYCNDDKAVILTLKDKSSKDAIDLTGKTVKVTVNSEENPTDTTNQLFSLAATILSATGGRISVAPSKAQSAQTPGTYYYDVQITTTATSVVDTAGKGEWVFIQDITKA